ncbi:zinc-ribbon domain-containing protein [Kitasatospora sp. NPDC056076]|uniref:NADase-type glycan-binding domain-containing protein n=1 Tax=Kitasatospora sp. NPDC056076 TaxID=3345703 RepID=UPI0035DAC2D5
MPVCPECGTANAEGDDFCGNCGAYLGWSRRAPAAGAAPAPVAGPAPVPVPAEREPGPAAPEPRPQPEAESAPEPEPGPAAPEPAAPDTSRTWRNVSRRVTSRSRRTQPPVAPEPVAVPEVAAPEPAAAVEERPVEKPPVEKRPVEEPPSPPSVETSRSTSTRARPVPAPAPPSEPAPAPAPEPDPRPRPPAAPQTEPTDPVAVQPAKPVAPRPVVRASAVEEAQDGPPCPRCGTPNLPERRFCRRCAAPLTVTAAAPELPWWRTRWPFRRRVRIGGSGNALRRTIALIVLLALVVAGVLLYPLGKNAYQDVLDKLGSTAPVSPSLTTASAAVEGHPASAADDGLSNTYWGAPAIGDSVDFTFRTPFRLVDLIVHTGASADPEQFRQQARPLVLALEVTASDGEVHRKQVTLNDQPGPQTVATGISDVVQVKLTVREAAGTGPGRTVALAEVEFFKRT